MASMAGILSGPGAFYRDPNYVEITRQQLAWAKDAPEAGPPPPKYCVCERGGADPHTFDCVYRIIKVAKVIFSIVIFPVGIYLLLREAARCLIVPTSLSSIGYPEKWVLPDSLIEEVDKFFVKLPEEMRKKIPIENSQWKYKRITVEYEGCSVDAVIIGTVDTLSNGRWVLASNGNYEFYEDKLGDRDFKELLEGVGGNAIVFNYPGAGASDGPTSRDSLRKSYQAMLRFLGSQSGGIGAKEIIGYGYSLGGAVQGEALENFKLEKGIRYVFVKRQTFSDIASVVEGALGGLVKFLGWNMSPVESSKKRKVPEIILQTAHVRAYEELTNSFKLKDDGVISAEASLAKALLDDPLCSKSNKVFIGIPDEHDARLSNVPFLAAKINKMLLTQRLPLRRSA